MQEFVTLILLYSCLSPNILLKLVDINYQYAKVIYQPGEITISFIKTLYQKIMKLFLKYMVSIRCKMLVKAELEKLGLHYKTVELGEAEIEENISPAQWDELNIALKRSGIELIENKKSILIEKIKAVIVELVHYSEEPLEIKLSEYLSHKLFYDYTYLANLFSESQGVTIEHFYIVHKIERIKELLIYDELSISEIAWKMHYSSAAHLSNQFKKMTGLTPSFFKKLKDKKRKTLDDI